MAEEMQLSETSAEVLVDDDMIVHPGSEDEFDQLRQKSTRANAANAEIDEEESGKFTPGQGLAIAILVLLNILIIGFAILVATGRVAI